MRFWIADSDSVSVISEASAAFNKRFVGGDGVGEGGAGGLDVGGRRRGELKGRRTDVEDSGEDEGGVVGGKGGGMLGGERGDVGPLRRGRGDISINDKERCVESM